MPSRAEKIREAEARKAQDAARDAAAPAPPPASRLRGIAGFASRPGRAFGGAALAASIALLALFAGQAWVAAERDSVTIDEFLHLPIGLHVLKTGDLREDPINVHGARVISALPMLADEPVFDPPPDTHSWNLGVYFMEANRERYHELFFHSRLMMVLLSLFAAITMARWTFELYGAWPAVGALALFALSPSLLAHGHIVTVDVAGALGFLLALYANWRLLDAPSLRRALWLGLAVGVANLLKLSASVLGLMILATWLLRIAVETRERLALAQWAKLMLVAGLAALVTINVGYGFEGTFAPLTEARLSPGGRLAGVATSMPWLRLPLPQQFLEGVDMVLEVGKNREPSYFLWGELSAEGWWYYHLAAFAVKCPLPVLAAAIFSIAAWIAGRSPGRRDYAVFVPVLLLFAANTAFNSLYIGERHVLAAYPLLFIGISPWLAGCFERLASGLRDRATLAVSALAALLLVWNAAGTFAVAPRYLQYFNEWAGGPERGHRVLIDSNIDWGQDLIRLREYMDANGIDSVALAYFGRVHPAVYGIRFTPLERGVSKGKAVVSATFLMGRPYFWFFGGRYRWVPSRTYEWLQGHKPVARVGSMFVFDLP